ncbi:MAG: hypothetical protein EOP47_29860 [Sphingobacteriaceae bacterium]|nr:MAG: hypothetical protein EOP47_29860 [Sphingobacteriaceae bacterium]
MKGKLFTHVCILIFLLFAATVTSCRKDEDVKAATQIERTDSLAVSSSLGSFLATSGKLKVYIADTTYTFDAATDSIAFVKVDTAGNQYFGVTAINKEHNISFGISGMGVAASKAVTNVAGSQFLFKIKNQAPLQYTLSSSAHELELGNLTLKKYSDSKKKVFAKGTFTTFLAKEAKEGSPFYKVTGSFDLKLEE